MNQRFAPFLKNVTLTYLGMMGVYFLIALFITYTNGREMLSSLSEYAVIFLVVAIGINVAKNIRKEKMES